MNTKWIGWAQLVLGIWIGVSPWILGYWRVTPALWSQVVAGVILVIISLWQLVGTEEKHEG